MNYTFCKTCENEFDLDDIGEENECPHCGCEYEWIENDQQDDPINDFLADDGDW